MAQNSKIEWTDHTFNPWMGCYKVSEGCANCYAEAISTRFGGDLWGKYADRRKTSVTNWRNPVKWNAQAQKENRRYRVFCASMADVFEKHSFTATDIQMNKWREELWKLIEATPHLDWQLLTKRPENIMPMIPTHWVSQFPSNVWIGTTVENQEQAENRIPHLLRVPAKVRFLSCEPLLSQLMLQGNFGGKVYNYLNTMPVGPRIHWVIAGGESGHRARPVHPDWVRSIREQCKAAYVPFFFKQWGEWLPDNQDPEELVGSDFRKHEFPDGKVACRVGKKLAGRLLDGVEHNMIPGTDTTANGLTLDYLFVDDKFNVEQKGFQQ